MPKTIYDASKYDSTLTIKKNWVCSFSQTAFLSLTVPLTENTQKTKNSNKGREINNPKKVKYIY